MKVPLTSGFSVRKRIYLSFSILVMLFVINGIVTIVTLYNNRQLASYVSGIVDPTLHTLEQFDKMLMESKMLTTNWVFLRSKQQDKIMLKKLHEHKYADLKRRLTTYSVQLNDQYFRDSLQIIFTGFEQLLTIEKDIMTSLQKFEDYDDIVIRMEAERKIEDEVLPRTDSLTILLGNFIEDAQQLKIREHADLERSSSVLTWTVISLTIVIILIGLFLAIYMTRVIVGPINRIKCIVNDLGKGIIRKSEGKIQHDEIGEMIRAVNNLTEKTMANTRFANEVGMRNFDIPFQPLSEEDELGKALIRMRDNLRLSETELQESARDLHNKDELLQAVAAATHELISNNDHEKAMGQAIRLLGLKMNADIVNIYENTGDLLGDGFTSQLMRWTREDNNITYRHPDFQRITSMTYAFEKLASNNIYYTMTDQIEDVLLKIMFERTGVKALAAIPIFLNEQFWGFVSFNNCKEKRQWTDTEFSILKSFAVTLGSAIERHQMEAQLIDSKEKAEAASVAKSEFMANMSHELRTPMNGIIGFTELVLTTKMNKTQSEYLQNVNRSAYNLLNIINDILDFSKLEAGKLFIENITFSLNDVVEETVDMLSIKAQEKDLELICSIDPRLPDQFIGDATRIRQILINLIGNAIKFTSQGEILVKVEQESGTTVRGEEEIYNLKISIKDTGIGIPQNKINEIFESFTQADSSTTRKFGGTGLGLTISKHLAELMGGALRVESEEGKGSTFTLELGLQGLEDTPKIPVLPRGYLHEVLVIDDNITNCYLVQGIFEYLNIPCKICFNGPDAIKMIHKAVEKNKPFDLIITDHQMPDMDGITLVREIKNMLSGSSQPFIMMLSSLEKTMIQQEAEKIGIDKFLSKPVKLNALTDLLSTLFKKPEQKQPDVKVSHLARFTDGKPVLVAEDNVMNMALITEVLTKMQLQVIRATNGNEVMELLKEHHPGVIFMDVNMPELDGFETTRRIRQLPGLKGNIPIIALTADAMKEDKERCLQVGMNEFISKPFQLKEIESVLFSYLVKDAHLHKKEPKLFNT